MKILKITLLTLLFGGLTCYGIISHDPPEVVAVDSIVDRMADFGLPEPDIGGTESKIELPADSTFRFPIADEDWKVTSPFGVRVSPIYGILAHHDGVDISIDNPARGMPQIAAVADGQILEHWYSHDTKGRHIVIDHGWGRSHYCHLSTSYIHERNPDGTPWQVRAGEVIGRMGDTGAAFGAHLHFELEVEIDGEMQNVNPMLYLDQVLPEWENVEILSDEREGGATGFYGAIDTLDVFSEKIAP